MEFTILSINKELDIYEVVSNTGEKKITSAISIVMVMLQDFVFTNAQLTNKGFSVKFSGRTRYVQIANMNRQIQNSIQQKINRDKIKEELKKKQMTKAINKEGHVRIDSKKSNQKRLVYKGEIFLSVQGLCKKYNRDVEEFKTLYNKGYSLDEALGFIQPRPESMVQPRAKIDKILDSMEKKRV